MRVGLFGMVLAFGTAAATAQTVTEPQRVKPADAGMDCAVIASENKAMADLITAGDPTRTAGQAVAGGTANVGGQLAGAVVAQSGMFGAFGGLVSKLTGSVAQQQVEQRLAPDAAAQQRAALARDRQGFLNALASAKACRADDPSFAGNALSADEFQRVAGLGAGPAGTTTALAPLSLAQTQTALAEPVAPLAATFPLQGDLKLAGRRYYIAEFRVLFEVGGRVSANTRAAYLGGNNYGATRSTIRYALAQPDVAVMQAITDRAWADFQQRVAAAGVKIEPRANFVAQHGEVYAATEPATTAAAPVTIDQNLGHTERKYMVFAPTGMTLHSRGFAGLGAGNLSKRMEFIKGQMDGLSVSVAVNIAALETSGSGSSLFNRDGASTGAGAGMTVVSPPDGVVAQVHADSSSLRLAQPVAVPGTFARMREVGGYDTTKDGVARSMQILSNMAGVAANNSKTVDMQVDLDGLATPRMVLQGLTGFNQALVEKLAAIR